MIRRTLVSLFAALAAVVVLAGCTVPAPPGAAPLRYRDAVFSGFTVTRDLQYGSAPDQVTGSPVALKLDLYQPTGDTVTKRPVLVYVHGGGYSGGDKNTVPATDFATTFAKLGYVAVSINYRLISSGCTGSAVRPDCVIAAINAQHDAQAAVRWLRANATTYRIDPARLAIAGESAGAITATLVGTRPDDPGTSGNPGPSSAVGAFMSISGGVPGGGFAGPGDAPGLFFHGTADPIVPFQWSVDTSNALARAGVPALLEVQQGAGHVPYQFRNLFISQTDYWFYGFLDLAHAQGSPPAAARAFDQTAARMRTKYPQFAPRVSQLKRSYPQYTR
jgi:acetyl esterase/lipase